MLTTCVLFQGTDVLSIHFHLHFGVCEFLRNHNQKQTIKAHNSSKNWESIAKEAEEEEKKDVETGGGEAALQQMFKVCSC